MGHPTDVDAVRRRGRAVTDAEKRTILDRIYRAWTLPAVAQQRLGQLVFNAARFPSECDLFYVEDEAIATRVEDLARDGQ